MSAVDAVENRFYDGEAVDAVVVLNSPLLGGHEAAIVRRALSRTPRCMVLCADGGYDRLKSVLSQDQPLPLAAVADVVCGDLDSIRDASDAIETVDTNADFPRTNAFRVLTAMRRDQTVDNASHLPSQGGQDVPRPLCRLRVTDQNTGDFEKCMQLLHLVAASSPSDGHRVATPSSPPRCRVVVLGFSGGASRWDHEMATLHVAARFGTLPCFTVALHNAFSTVSFCRPSCTTVFRRNLAHEGPGCALVPLGDAPARVRTEGMAWDLDYQGEEESQTQTTDGSRAFFGFTSGDSRRNAFISTSNRAVDDRVLVHWVPRKGGRGGVGALAFFWHLKPTKAAKL